MPADRLIGIDLGTTAIKAAVLNKFGAVQGRFVENYSMKELFNYH